MSKKIAVVLSGCGFKDGAEIHESVLTLLAIERHGASYSCYAPDINQRFVHDHYRDQVTPGEERNVLVESARIARCNIQPLSKFDPQAFDAIVFPGGFGAALNLSSFAVDGPDCEVNDDVRRAIESMRELDKPIGALCISPVILAKLMDGIDLTIGSDEQVAGAINQLGCQHHTTDHGEIVVDSKNKIVTTPCYMLNASVVQIAEGADKLIAELLSML